MTSALPRALPLFARIFALMLGTVLLVQVLNFVVILMMPPPTPIVFSTNRIAAVAALGHDSENLLRIDRTANPMPMGGGERERHLARMIAADLTLPADAVRVDIRNPGPPMAMGVIRPLVPLHTDRYPRPRTTLENAVFGNFAVSIRISAGTWQVITPVSGGMGSWRFRITLWLLVAVAVAAPIAWALARRVAKPIGMFAAAAERLGRDPRAEPLALTGPPEIADAATAFNVMQARLNRYVEDRTTLIAAVAHDLRTPLMRLALRLEKAPPEIQAASARDIDEMNQRIGAAMAFVRDMTSHVQRQKIDLRSLAESVTDEFIDRGADVHLVDGPPVLIEGGAPSLKALLENLVGNAVRYAGNAHVTVERTARAAIIEVGDTGPGLPPEDLERAFEPFFRSERSRNRDTGGTGLDLASVRAVTRAHGGEATLANRPEGGLLARVVLPV